MNVEVGTCPICKIPLTVNSDRNQIKFCSKCHREFFAIENDNKQSKVEELDDIETSSGYIGEPILLCDEKDNTGFPRKKKEYYLENYFDSHVNIETREYIPSE